MNYILIGVWFVICAFFIWIDWQSRKLNRQLRVLAFKRGYWRGQLACVKRFKLKGPLWNKSEHTAAIGRSYKNGAMMICRSIVKAGLVDEKESKKFLKDVEKIADKAMHDLIKSLNDEKVS